MAKEDLLLRVEMGKLEIEPSKSPGNKNKLINFQQQKKFNTSKNLHSYRCACVSQRKNKNMTICKRKHRILKEPILKLPQPYNKNEYHITNKDVAPAVLNKESLSLHALVNNCNQLSISTDRTKSRNKTPVLSSENIKPWRNTISHDKHTKELSVDKGQSSSCSQQALNPPCDVTIDELASYFETLVHIPKKMSSMAEMMYI